VTLTVGEAAATYKRAMRNVQPVGEGICEICHTFIDPAYGRCYKCNSQPDMLDAVSGRGSPARGSQRSSVIGPPGRATPMRISPGRVVERLELVVDSAVDESGYAAVADAGAAGPVGGHVARFGEFEQAAVALVPRDRERRVPARDVGAGGGWSGRGVRGRPRAARGRRSRGAPGRLDAAAVEAGGELAQERVRAAQENSASRGTPSASRAWTSIRPTALKSSPSRSSVCGRL
jgi:hypothetical protein